MRFSRTIALSLLATPLLGQQFRPGFANDVLGQSPFKTLGAPVAADLDNDGRPDLVFGDPAHVAGVDHRILRNAGSRFEPVPTASLPPIGLGRATPIDFDGDGDGDLAMCSSPASLLRNDGGMQFVDVSAGLPQFFNQGTGEAFDIDGDGDQDLVLPWGRVLENDGRGAFVDATATRMIGPVGAFNIGDRLLVADFDGDGDLDLVLMSGLYRNDGTGHFTHDAKAGVGHNYGNAPFLLDVEGDGDFDVILATGHLFVNNGSGKFRVPTQALPTAVVAAGALVVGVGPIDGNGLPDLVVSVAHSSPTLPPSWIANDGAGSFPQANLRPLPLRSETIREIALADLDGDGDRDLVAVATFTHRPTAAEVLYNDGLGNWLSATEVASSYAPSATYHFTTVDLDGDGDSDVLSAAGVWRNDVNGQLTPVNLPYGVSTHSGTHHADFDGDGNLDLVGSQRIWLGVGNLQFVPGAVLFPGNSSIQRTYVLDLDGDGDSDVLAQPYAPFGPATWAAHVNDGTGQFTPAAPASYGLPPEAPTGLVTGDFDGDGRTDVMIAPFSPFFPAPPLQQLRNTGNGTFAPVTMPATLWSIHGMHVADLDGDGDLDVITASTSIGFVFENDGSGSFTAQPLTGLNAYGMHLDDVDLDGDVDLWVLHNGWYAMAINDGNNQFTVDATRVSSDRAEHDAVALVVLDLDRDGDRDALVIARNQNSGFHYQAVLWNHLRQLRPRTMARPGGSLELELTAVNATTAPTAAVFAASTAAADLPLGDLGWLGIDVSQSVLWITAFGSGAATSALPIPPGNGLRGLHLHTQALLVAPTSLRLSNAVSSVIID